MVPARTEQARSAERGFDTPASNRRHHEERSDVVITTLIEIGARRSCTPEVVESEMLFLLRELLIPAVFQKG